MARAATVTQGAGPVRARVRAGDPGHRRRRGLGERRGPRVGRRGRSSSSAVVLAADGSEARLDAGGLALGYRDSRLKHPGPGPAADGGRPGRGAEVVLSARRSGSRRPRRTRSATGSTRSGAGARPTSRSASRAPARTSATRRGDSAGRLIDAAGLKGLRIGGAVGQREARQLPRQRPQGHARPTSAGSATGSGSRSPGSSGSSSSPRSCSSATGGPSGRDGRRAR